MTQTVLLDENTMNRTLKRIAHEILERSAIPDNIVLVGIKTRGEFLAQRIAQKINEIEQLKVPVEVVDITFYRDDLSIKTISQDPEVKNSSFKENLTEKHVVIVDDVLYTGRTVRAAMDAILNAYRPTRIQLAVLIDRGHRELPIRADYVGKNIPTSKQERVAVKLTEYDKTADEVILIKP